MRKPRRARDTGRGHVYAAEDDLFPTGCPDHFYTIDELRSHLDWVLSGVYCSHFRHLLHDVAIHPGREGDGASWLGGKSRITLPPGMRYNWVLLHELAHCLRDITGSKNGPGHGPMFRRHYLELIRSNYVRMGDVSLYDPFISNSFADCLELSFRNRGLIVTSADDALKIPS